MERNKIKVYKVMILAFVFIFSSFSYTISSKEYNLNDGGDGEINYWAIIAGWGGNPHQEPCVNREIRMLKRILSLYGWNDSNLYILQNEQAKKEAIFASFIWLDDMAVDEDDVVFIFFSFHGSHKEDQPPLDEPNNMDGFLVPFDFEFEIQENGILDDELGAALDTVVSQNVIVVVESCHAGEMIDGTQDLCGDGRVILTSSTEEEASSFLYRKVIGLFPYYIIKGLRGLADKDHNGWISAEELFRYAERRTIFQSYISSFLLGMQFNGQHPQIYDGWPSEENNSEDLNILNLKYN